MQFLIIGQIAKMQYNRWIKRIVIEGEGSKKEEKNSGKIVVRD